ncbi:MAG: hypothetical protein GXY91_04120 [Clostridia bacterium]|nr:hypothetical protein [Clostridia bacterium]
MSGKFKICQRGAEQTLVILFILLFYISFIESYRLLGITAVTVLIYSVITCQRRSFLRLIKSVVPFVILLLLPTVIRYLLSGTWEDLDFTLMIICKILISAILLGTVVAKYSALFLVDGILNLGLPPLFNRILALTFRYFHMVNQDVQIGRKALTSRGINERRGLAVLPIFGEWIGGFFLKSTYHSDMVFKAMKSRGFEGTARKDSWKNSRLIIEAGMLILFLMVVLIVDGKI